MTTSASLRAPKIPDDVARAILLPESYTDEKNVTYPAMKWLRQHNPFGRAEIEGYDPVHIVTRYDDVVAIERQVQTFANAVDNPLLNTRAGDDLIKSMTGGTTRAFDALPFMDPPEHTEMRRLFNGWYRPGNIKLFSDQVRSLAKREVDRLFEEHNGDCDFASDFGLTYPLRVLLTLFGLKPEDEPAIMELTQGLFGAADPENQTQEGPSSPDAAAQQWMAAVQQFAAFFHERMLEARKNPREDLLSIIANSEVDGELLEERYVFGQFIGIATAGHDTTSATLNAAMLALIENPDQATFIREHPELMERFVEEAIRYTSPVKHFMRTATHDSEISGIRVDAGDRLFLSYPSANRDENRFGLDSDRFDVSVERPKHLGFGFGPHQCQGMTIARLELAILFEELLPRLTSIELIGRPKYTHANFVTGIKSLPVRIQGA